VVLALPAPTAETTAVNGAVTAVASVTGAVTAGTGADVASAPAAWMTDPVTSASPDVTFGATAPLVTTCVTVRSAFPVPATTVMTADPGTCPA
jgi:hypothetical protein